jgi:hypothetical protein
MPNHTERRSFMLFTCNAAAVKLNTRYSAVPNSTTYAKNGKIRESTIPTRSENTSREGKK